MIDQPLIEIVQADASMMDELQKNAAADNHGVLQSTHVIKKNGEIVGFLSIGAIPTVHMWMDSKKTGVKDSIVMEKFFMNECKKNGAKFVVVPVPSHSPYAPLMEKAGYHKLSYDQMWLKGVI